MQRYSDFFKTLHDETGPTGYLGRGTHYSVLRAVVFNDPAGALQNGQFGDFAVIWDEDHDTRVMGPIEEIYHLGLLSSFIMFGEHKGHFTAILSNEISSRIEAIRFDPALLTSISELDLSVRTENCLKNDNIFYVGDIVRQSQDYFLGVPNFGRKSLNEIKEVLAQRGLHLGMEVPGWPPANIEQLVEVDLRLQKLEHDIKAICRSLPDPWTATFGGLGSSTSIIDDEIKKVNLYLRNLEMLWRLGPVPRQPRRKVATLAAV